MIALSTTCVVIIGGSPMMLYTLPILSNSWATILQWWNCGDRSAGLFRSPKPEGSDSLWRNYSKTDNIFDLSGLHIFWKQESVANGASSSDFGLLTACMQEKATESEFVVSTYHIYMSDIQICRVRIHSGKVCTSLLDIQLLCSLSNDIN